MKILLRTPSYPFLQTRVAHTYSPQAVAMGHRWLAAYLDPQIERKGIDVRTLRKIDIGSVYPINEKKKYQTYSKNWIQAFCLAIKYSTKESCHVSKLFWKNTLCRRNVDEMSNVVAVLVLIFVDVMYFYDRSVTSGQHQFCQEQVVHLMCQSR